MSLYLVQHGRSLPKEVDPDQGLSKAGKSDTARIATVAQGYNIRVAAIRHSGKTRARQTAKIMASYLNPTVNPEETADVAWGLGFIFLALVGQFASSFVSIRGILVLSLVTVWGLRLSFHIGLRNRGKTEDRRYANWRKEWGSHAALRAYFQIFLL